MKILVFSHKECWKSDASPIGWATDGGFVFHMQAIASLADELEIICLQRPKADTGEVTFRDKKLSFYTIKVPSFTGLKRKAWVIYTAIKKLPFLIRKIREADLIHVPIPSDIGTIGMLLAKWMNKPLFIRHCGNWSVSNTKAQLFWKSFMERNTGKNMVGLATGGGINPPSEINPKIEWIFSTSLLEREISDMSSLRKKRFLPKKYRLVTASRQSKNKGVWRSIDAVKVLVEQGFDVEFIVLGTGEYLETLRHQASRLNLEQHVIFKGQQSNEGVIEELIKSDIFIFPSGSEGFPKAVLEAMAVGLPVITSDVSVLPILVEETESGFVLKDLEAESLAEAVKCLMTDSEQYQQFSRNASQAATSYSLENWVDQIKEALNKEFGWKLSRDQELIK